MARKAIIVGAMAVTAALAGCSGTTSSSPTGSPSQHRGSAGPGFSSSISSAGPSASQSAGSAASTSALIPGTTVTAAAVRGLVTSKLGTGGAGVQVAIDDNGKVVLDQGYGYADVAAKTPVTTSTRFDIGSVTKQFTAAAIQQLVAQRKLSLGSSLASVCPAAASPRPSRSRRYSSTSQVPRPPWS